MKKNLFISAAVAAMMAMPALAQSEAPVKINGSLIDWYYYGKDIHSNDMGWHQQPAGWIDESGEHSNVGLLSLTLSGNASKPLLPEFLIRHKVFYSNCSGLYTGDNVYYSFFGHEVNATENIDIEYGSEEYEILVRKWTWDIDEETGEYKNVKWKDVGKLANQPTDLAYDPENDIVYGVFNIGGANGYKLGTLNMENFKITWISREAMPLTGELRTLACDSRGKLFGTDKSGNIYKVSTTDGKLTKIGEMGFKSQQKMMSATIDYRTNKMYWLGYTNDGKKSADNSGTNNTLTIAEGGRDTGLYEIDTKTGKATLIGMTEFVDFEEVYDDDGQLIDYKKNQYGKMQMTGIYVEGSIVRPEFDLKATLTSYPVQMTVGETGSYNVIVNVKNNGRKSIRGSRYSITLYADDQIVDYIDNDGEYVYTRDIEPGMSYNYSLSYNAPSTAGTKVLKVLVNCESDERQDNNVLEGTVRVLSKEIFPSTNITGEVKSKGITLRWENPRGHVTDGAEDYVPFTYSSLGGWTMFDGDTGYTQKANNWNSSIDYPNWNTPKAFIVMDPQKAGFDLAVGGEKFDPHSGNQYFAAWWTAVPDNTEAGGHQIPNNDWMISPTLSGFQQTIKFWAKGYKGIEAEGYQTEMNHPELMRVLATKVDYNSQSYMNFSDWTVVKDTFQVDNSQWTEYTADIPGESKHFALQCCSKEGFVLMIDDISFDTTIRVVTGYRICRNGRMIAVVGSNGFSYTDNNPVEGSIYTVTVLYENGESMPSNAFIYGKIEGDVNGDGAVDVSDIANVIDVMADCTNDSNADANHDGIVDVADIAEIISLMAGK